MKKRLLLLCFATLLGIVGMYGAPYDLYIAGVQVTDANCNNIMTGVKYNPASKLLTLNNANISATGAAGTAGSGIYSNIDGLTIQVRGTNTIKSANYSAMNLYGSTTFTTYDGNGKLNLYGSNSYYAISSSTTADLTFDGRVEIIGKTYGFFLRAVRNLNFTNCIIRTEGTSYVAYGIYGSVKMGSSAVHTRCIEHYNTTLVDVDDRKVLGYKDGTSNGKALTGKMTIAPTYGFGVAGRGVWSENASNILGDGTVSYNSVSKNLTFKNANINVSNTYIVENTNNDGLDIHFSGNNKLNVTDGYGVIGVVADTKLQSDDNNISELSCSSNYRVFYFHADKKLTLNANLKCQGARLFYQPSTKGTVNIESGCIRFKSLGSYTPINVGNFNLYNDMKVVTPQNATFSNGTLKVNSTDYIGDVYIDKPYGIKVSDVEVTATNMNDVLGDGKVSYSPSASTLTLKNANVNTINNYGKDGLTIKLSGKNTATKLEVRKNTTVTSLSGLTGSLDIPSPSYAAIQGYDTSTLTIKDCSMNIGYTTYAVMGGGVLSLVIDNAEFKAGAATAVMYNIYGLAYKNNVSYIEPAVSPVLKNQKLVDSNGNYIKSVHLAPLYGLILSGVNVTPFNTTDILGNGLASYNASTKTLKLKPGTYNGLKNTKIDGFTLSHSGGVKFTGRIDILKTSVITGSSYKDVLEVYSTAGAGIYVQGGDLDIKNGVVKTTSEKASGIAGNGSNNLYIASTGGLLAKGTSGGTSCSVSNFKDISYASGIQLFPTYATVGSPSDASSKSVVYKSDNDRFSGNVIIGAAFGVEVAGYCPVVGVNMDDILLDGGRVRYNSGYNTLYLKDAYIVNMNNENAIHSNGALNIEVEGKNTISITNANYGIYAKNNLSITGTNKSNSVLNIYSDTNVANEPIVANEGKITVSDVTLNVTHARAAIAAVSDANPVSVELRNVDFNTTMTYDSKGAITKADNIRLSNVTFNGNQPFIYNNLKKDIKMLVSGTNTIGFANRGISNDAQNANLIIEGTNKDNSKLILTSAENNTTAIYTRHNISARNVTLSLDAKNYGIYANNGSNNVMFTVDNTRVDMQGGSSAMLHIELNMLGNMNIIEPLGAYNNIVKGSIYLDGADVKHAILDNYDPIDYSLKVNGIDVTSLNAGDVMGDGKVKYDAATNTLNLNSLTICNSSGPAIAYTGTEPLFTINVKGGNVVIDNSTVTGSAIQSTTNMLIKSEDNSTLTVDANTADASQKPITMFNSSKLTVENININIYDPHTAIGGASDAEPATIEVKNSNIAAYLDLDEPYKYQNAVISNTKDIILDKAQVVVDGKGYNSIVYAKENLNITVKSEMNRLSFIETSSNNINGIVLDGDAEATLNIVGDGAETGDIFVNSKHDAVLVKGKNKTVSIQDTDFMLYGRYAGIIGQETDYTLNIKNSKGSILGETIAMDNAKPLVLDNVDVATFGIVYEPTSGKYIKGTENAKEVDFAIHMAKDYNISIVNTATSEVTAINSDNLSFTDGTGTITLDVAAETLTIDNINLPDYSVIVQPNDFFTANVVVTGDNVLRNLIVSSSSISGNGSLKLKETVATEMAFRASENIVIDGVTLDIEGEYGMMAQKNLKLKNVNASLKGMFVVYGTLDFEGCSITKPEDYVMDGGMMKVGGAPYTGEVIISTATTYDLKVKGVSVTDLNAGDILGDGTMYYDNVSKKLVMNNVDSDDWFGPSRLFIESNIEDLYVEVNGDNKIKAGLKFNKYSVILGNGSLSITQGLHEGNAAITTEDVLYIKNITLTAHGSNVGVRGPGSIYFVNAIASIKGAFANVMNVADINLSGCGYELPADGVYNITEMRMDDFDGNAYKGEIKIRPLTNYNLVVMGIHVNDVNCSDILHDGGKLVYDDVTKTFSMNGFSEIIEGTFLESNEELNIEINGDNNLGAAEMILNADANITGSGKLNMSSGFDCVTVNNALLTIKDANLAFEGENGNGIVGTGTAVIAIYNSDVTVKGKEKAITGFVNYELIDCATTKNSYYSMSDYVLKNMSNETMKEAVITPATIYDGYVWNTVVNNGFDINSLNANDVMEDGSFSFDPVSHACVFTDCNHPEMEVCVDYNIDVTLNGTNNLASVFFPGDTNIKGNGVLNINDEVGYDGFTFGNNLTIEDVTINVKSISKGIVSSSTSGELNIKGNAHVKAQGDNGSICEISALNLNGVMIVQPSDAAFDAMVGGVAVGGSVVTSEVKIIPESEVGIHEITADEADAKKFDITGRQVTDSYRGIVIRNGKKVAKK